MKWPLIRNWLIIPAVLVGVFIFVSLVKNKSAPEVIQLAETSRVVRVIDVPQLTVISTVHGTGNVKPSQVWQGVAQVSGKIIEMNPRLKKGALIKADVMLIKIDPSDYQLAMEEAETTIEATKAQLADLRVREKNSKASVLIEEKVLKINQAELERKRKLRNEGSITASEFEREQRNVLAQEQSMQSLKNTINLYPTEKRRLNAEVKRLEAQLSGAKLNLDRTTLIMPFHGRVAETKTEIQQYARQGDVLFVVDGIEKAEIEVQLPMERMATLIQGMPKINIDDADNSSIGDLLGLSAQALLNRGTLNATWPAKVARISDSLDPQTRTVGVIVEVMHPYAGTQPGVRPPLTKGLFVDVKLQGKARPDKLVIPNDALHQNNVYVVNQENRLEKRAVTIGLKNSYYVVIESGLLAGERIVVSDLVPAIDGMLLEPLLDDESLLRLKQDVSGNLQEVAL